RDVEPRREAVEERAHDCRELLERDELPLEPLDLLIERWRRVGTERPRIDAAREILGREPGLTESRDEPGPGQLRQVAQRAHAPAREDRPELRSELEQLERRRGERGRLLAGSDDRHAPTAPCRRERGGAAARDAEAGREADPPRVPGQALADRRLVPVQRAEAVEIHVHDTRPTILDAR